MRIIALICMLCGHCDYACFFFALHWAFSP